MIKVIKIFSCCALFSLIVSLLGEYVNSKGFDEIVNSQILGVSATILGFTSAGIFFLLGKLYEIEVLTKLPKLFLKTKTELINSTKYLIYSFVFLLLLLLLIPQTKEPFLLANCPKVAEGSVLELLMYLFSLNSLRRITVLATLFTQLYVIKDLIDAILNIVSHEPDS